MKGKIKVNLRSLNLRDDIFQTKYESSATRLSNLTEPEGPGRNAKFQSSYVERDTTDVWNNFAKVNQPSKMSKRSGQQNKAIRMRDFSPCSKAQKQPRGLYWDQSRLGASVDMSGLAAKAAKGQSNCKSKKRAQANQSMEVGTWSQKNASALGRHDPSNGADMDRIPTKRTENSDSDHNDEGRMNPIAASTTKYRVIYTKKGKNRSRTIDAHEMVLQAPSDGAGEDEVNQGAGEASLNYYMHNSDADKLETAKFQNTLGAFPTDEAGRPILVNNGNGQPPHGALGASPLKAPQRKQIGLKRSQCEASENTKTASAQKSERSRLLEGAALNEQLSFTSNEQRELLELQRVIANAATPAASGDEDKKNSVEAVILNAQAQNSPPHHQLFNAFPIAQQNVQYYHFAQSHAYNQDPLQQNLLTKATPRGGNVFDQDHIKMNQQLLQQSPGLEENLQIKKMQMNQYIHPKSILAQQVLMSSQMLGPGEAKDQNIGNDLSQPSHEGQRHLHSLNQIERRSTKQKVFLPVTNTEHGALGIQESKTLMTDGALKASQAARDTAHGSQQANAAVASGADSYLGAIGHYGAGVAVTISDAHTHSRSKQQPASGNSTQLQQLRQFQRNQQILVQLEASHSAMSENWQLVVGNLREGLGDHESSYKTIVNENGGDSIQSMTGLTAVRGVELKTNSKKVDTALIAAEDQHKAGRDGYAHGTLVITAQRLSDESPGHHFGAEAKVKGLVCLDNGGITTTRMDKSSKASIHNHNATQRFNEESPSPALQKMDLQIEQIITQRKKQHQRQNQAPVTATDLNQSKQIFFQQQQQQLENLQELRNLERSRAFRQYIEQQQQVRAPTEFRKSINKLAGNAGTVKKLSKSLNPAKMKYYIGKALHNMSRTAQNEGIFGRQIKCSSQLHHCRPAAEKTRRQSIQARMSSGEGQRALSAQTKLSDEGKKHIHAREALQPNGAPDDSMLATPKTGTREKTGDLCKRVLTVQVGDGTMLGRRTGQMSREFASRDGTVHASQQHFSSPAERAGSLHIRPSEDNRYSPDVHSATQKPPRSQMSQAQHTHTPTQRRLKEFNNSPYDQVLDASPGIQDSILVQEPQTATITQYAVAQQNRVGSQCSLASRQISLPQSQETMHVKSQVQPVQQSQAIGSVEVGQISTSQTGIKGESQYLSAQSVLRIEEKQYLSYQPQLTKKACEPFGGTAPQQSAILEVAPASAIAERDLRSLYSTLKDYSHHYPQNFVTLMEDSQQERDYSILQNSLNQSLAQALKNEPFRKLLRPSYNKDYIQRVHQLVSGREALDGQARFTHEDFRNAESQLQSKQEKENKSKAGTMYDSSVMKYLNRSIDVDSTMQHNHYDTIHSNFITGRSSKLSEPQNGVGRSHHIRNQFISKQKRIQRNNLNRSLNVPSIKNDIHGQVSRISNEELIQQQIDLLPNFGLYQTRVDSVRRYAAGTMRRNSKPQFRERSPVEVFEETGRSFFSKPRSPESTQNSLGGPRMKKTALHCQKPHEVDAVLQQIRNLQQTSERVRYEYAMSRFGQAEDAMRPGSKTQNRSIRLETTNVTVDPNAQAHGAGTLPTRRIHRSGAHVHGAGGDGECQEEGEQNGKESGKNSLHDKRKSQDALNQENKVHHIPTQSNEELGPHRVPTCQSPSMTQQNEQSFAAMRDSAVLDGSNGSAACTAIQVAQAAETRMALVEDQRQATHTLAQELNADLQQLGSSTRQHRNAQQYTSSKREGETGDPRGSRSILSQLPSQVPQEQSEAAAHSFALTHGEENYKSAMHQMDSPEHFTSDPEIGRDKDGTKKNAHSPQNTQAPCDANGVHS